MRVLTHFEDLNLTSLKFNILNRHLLLGHNLDCHRLPRLFVKGRLDETKLTFSKSLFDLIEIEDIGVSDNLFDCCHPSLLLSAVREVVGSGLVWREDQLERIENGCAVELLLSLVFDEDTNQTMHTLMLLFSLILVDIELLAK